MKIILPKNIHQLNGSVRSLLHVSNETHGALLSFDIHQYSYSDSKVKKKTQIQYKEVMV